MLSLTSTTVGSNLSEIFTGSGCSLVPKHNTLLSALTQSVYVPAGVGAGDLPQALVSASQGNFVKNRDSKSYVGSSHDAYMDNYVEDLSTLVKGYLGFCRNVVNREINLLTEEVTQALTSYTYKDPEQFFQVTYFKLNDVFQGGMLATELESYRQQRTKSYMDAFALDSVLAPDYAVESLLLIGDEEEDRLIQSWVREVGSEACRAYLLNHKSVYEMTTGEALNYALANYLFHRNLTERGDLSLGMSVTELRSRASSNRDFFATMLLERLSDYERDLRLGRVFTNYDSIPFSYLNARSVSLTVYEASFAKLAEKGFNIELLFGYVVSGEPCREATVETLEQRADVYLSKWANVRTLYLISMNAGRLDVVKQVLRERFVASLGRTYEDGVTEGSGQEETIRMGSDYIDQLRLTDLDDMDGIFQKLVAAIRFRHTNADYLLTEMKEILKQGEHVEPLEAALYATIHYVTDFLVESVDVVKT